MSFIIFIQIFLSKSEVNHVYFIDVRESPDEEVIWFNIPMEDPSWMNELDKFKHF